MPKAGLKGLQGIEKNMWSLKLSKIFPCCNPNSPDTPIPPQATDKTPPQEGSQNSLNSRASTKLRGKKDHISERKGSDVFEQF